MGDKKGSLKKNVGRCLVMWSFMYKYTVQMVIMKIS